MMNIKEITSLVKNYAIAMGFDLVGITSDLPFENEKKVALDRFHNGLMGGMPWYNENRIIRGSDPHKLLPSAHSIISLALNYFTEDTLEPSDSPRGKISRYASGYDYHKIVEDKLNKFVQGLSETLGTKLESKIYVDTGPLQDRAVAQRSGLGWYGKNTNILTSSHGSWVFLAEVITNLQLEPDTPSKKTCGACTICIDECPTGALIAPYVLDNERCISYLTIENRGAIPMSLRKLVGDWIFGCDICQDVCPVNRKAQVTDEPTFRPGEHGYNSVELIPLLSLSPQEFNETFKNSPVKRTKRSGLLRNVCVALDNIGDPKALPALFDSLQDKDPIIRGHAAWAIGEIGGEESTNALAVRANVETDETVLEEISSAIINSRKFN